MPYKFPDLFSIHLHSAHRLSFLLKIFFIRIRLFIAADSNAPTPIARGCCGANLYRFASFSFVFFLLALVVCFHAVYHDCFVVAP